MRKDHKSSTVLIFIGLLLTVVFVVGRISSQNPDTFRTRYMVDVTLESFLRFCTEWWIPAGVIGIPMFLITLVVSLWRESKENRKKSGL